MENGRCRLHGGLTPKGIASPHFKTGRYCKDKIPGAIREGYERAIADPDRLAVYEEVAILHARVQQLLNRLPNMDTSHRFAQVAGAWKKLREAQRNKSAEGVILAMGALDELIETGLSESQDDDRIWQEILSTFNVLRRLTVAETNRQVRMKALVSTEDAMRFARSILFAVQQHVHDPKALVAIEAQVREEIARESESLSK
jgi:hypothetical protein